MSRFTVTAVFTVEADATEDAVRLEANRQLRDLARQVTSNSWGWGSNGRSARLDVVTVEQVPEPEPTVTLTQSELQATIAACVAEALAELDAVASAE